MHSPDRTSSPAGWGRGYQDFLCAWACLFGRRFPEVIAFVVRADAEIPLFPESGGRGALFRGSVVRRLAKVDLLADEPQGISGFDHAIGVGVAQAPDEGRHNAKVV